MTANQVAALSHVSHIGFVVRDLEATCQFYVEALGFKVWHTSDIPGAFHTLHRLGPEMRMHVRILEKDGFNIELIALDAPEVTPSPLRPMNVQGYAMIALRVDEIAPVLRAVEAAGGKILHETHLQHGGLEIICCTDPEGNRLEMFHRSAAPGAEA